jgi:hypothetical protein
MGALEVVWPESISPVILISLVGRSRLCNSWASLGQWDIQYMNPSNLYSGRTQALSHRTLLDAICHKERCQQNCLFIQHHFDQDI